MDFTNWPGKYDMTGSECESPEAIRHVSGPSESGVSAVAIIGAARPVERWRQLMRLTVGKKIALGIAVISMIGLVVMLIIYVGLESVGSAVQKYAHEEAPFTAAAYEMEVNVNGIGFSVLKYMATRNERYRAWVAEDKVDFRNYHATYML